MKVLEDIADGEVVQKVRLPLAVVLPHVVCPNCGELGLEAKNPKNIVLTQFEVMTSASPADRNKAIDTLAKYGLGAIRQTSVEEIQERLTKTIALISKRLGVDVAEPLLKEMEEIWK